MPGIVGIVGKLPSGAMEARRDAMLKPLQRERFDNYGTYSDAKLGVALGWACHQGSFSDCLPIWNEAKNICLIFFGQIFANGGQTKTLRANGHQFSPDNPSSLVHLYEVIGIQFLEKLNGWFSGVLVDLREKSVVLFNDRYGLQRIYYHENESGFYFSSEAKSLLKVLPELRKLDFQSVGELVSCGCPLQNRTLFRGVSLLPGAARRIFSSGQPARKETYFQKETWESQPLLSEPQFYEKLKETFERILPRYFRNEQPIGLSLTGGIDGRMIMAWAQAPPETLPCYTFGGSYRDCADVRLARKVAQVCGQPHRVIPVGREFLEDFPALATKAICVSDGAMDLTGAAELYVNRIAREIAPVRLTGNYGSEILRGNVAFGPGSLQDGLFDAGFERQVKATETTYAEEAQGHPVSFIAFKQVPWYHYARFSMEQSELTPRSPYLDNDLVSLMYQAPRTAVQSKQPSFRLIAEGNAALSQIPTDRGFRFRPIPLATRVNVLYQELTIRAEYAYDYGMPQWLAKVDHAFAHLHLERLFLGRHKFCHFRIWYRNQLAGYVKEMLLDSRTRNRPYLRGNCLERLVTSHVAGRGNFTSEIHCLLALELIQRELIESN